MQASSSPTNPGRALVSGGVLGSVLLAWLSLTLYAPGFGMVLAVFGSPIFAFFMLLRLLTLPPADGPTAWAGASMSHLLADRDLVARVAAANGGKCARCGGREPVWLTPILPIGRRPRDLERRLVALCAECVAKTPLSYKTTSGP